MAAVLAMMYLVLFSSLAVGFYAATTTSAQLASNDLRGSDALMAAESGMQLIRYQLANLNIPHNTVQANLFTTIYNQLSTNLNGTANMGGQSVGLSGSVISIPSGTTNYVALGGGSSFRATITQSGQQLIVAVVGNKGNLLINRTVQINYGIAQRASSVFNYGIASNGKITTAGASQILGSPDPTKGSLLSTDMVDATPVSAGGKVISGDISITNPTGNVSVAGSIGGTSNVSLINANHIHKGVPAPDFPTVDTSAFSSYAVTKYVAGNKTLDNFYIAPNTNPTFSGNTTIKGVLLIQTPNKVTFSGNVTIQGAIVVQNNPTGTISQNVLNFSGNTTVQGVETLPASYGTLRTLTGAFILAPGFAVNFSGDFGAVNGSIIADNINFSGNAGGNINGSIINLQNLPMTVNGSSDIIITSTGTTNYPTGVFFGTNYVPLADTYRELP